MLNVAGGGTNGGIRMLERMGNALYIISLGSRMLVLAFFVYTLFPQTLVHRTTLALEMRY